MTLRNLRAATLMSIVTGGGLSRQFLREQAQKIKGKTQREGIDGCQSGAHAKPGQLAEALWQRKAVPARQGVDVWADRLPLRLDPV